MSSDRRPAKVRVVSSGPIRAVEGSAAATPGRRRTDQPEPDVAGASTASAPRAEGASLLWVTGALVLFLVGCALGGALFVLSGLASAASL